MSNAGYVAERGAHAFSAIKAKVAKIGSSSTESNQAELFAQSGLLLHSSPTPTDGGTLTGNVVLTTAQVLSGLYHADPGGAGRSVTTPTAAEIVAAVTDAKAGVSGYLTIINEADADEPMTFTAGTDVTIVGNAVIEAYVATNLNTGTSTWLWRITDSSASEAVTFYRIA